MIYFTATAKMISGKESQALSALEKMTALVKQEEPDCFAYVVHISPDDSSLVVITEIYKDEEALEFHKNTPHFAEFIMGPVGTSFDKEFGLKIDTFNMKCGLCRDFNC